MRGMDGAGSEENLVDDGWMGGWGESRRERTRGRHVLG